MRAVDLEGAAHLVLANGVAFLDAEDSMLEAMLSGWQRQQRHGFSARRR